MYLISKNWQMYKRWTICDRWMDKSEQCRYKAWITKRCTDARCTGERHATNETQTLYYNYFYVSKSKISITRFLSSCSSKQSLKNSISPSFINQSSYFFQWIFLWYLSTCFVSNFNPTTRRTSRTSSRWKSTKSEKINISIY